MTDLKLENQEGRDQRHLLYNFYSLILRQLNINFGVYQPNRSFESIRPKFLNKIHLTDIPMNIWLLNNKIMVPGCFYMSLYNIKYRIYIP